MNTVVSINGSPVTSLGEPNPALIDMLERALEGAKSGLYQSGAIALTTVDGQALNQWQHNGQSFLLLASINYLHYDFVAAASR
jgi:hypothetical protein